MALSAYDGWHVVHMSGTDYEAEMVRDRLADAGIPAVILNQRDHAFNLTHGYLAKVKVLVPKACRDEASEILNAGCFTDEELTRAALRAAEDESDERD